MKNSSKSCTNNMKNCRIYSSSHTYQRKKWIWKRFSCGNMLCQLTKSRRWNRTPHTTLFSTSACISLMAVPSRVNSSMAKLFKQMFLCLSHWRANIFFWNIYILKRIFFFCLRLSARSRLSNCFEFADAKTALKRTPPKWTHGRAFYILLQNEFISSFSPTDWGFY